MANRWAIGVAVVVAFASAGCGERIERRDVEGVDCVVVNDGVGRPKHADCDWGNARPTTTDARR